MPRLWVVIPALDEEAAIGRVVAGLLENAPQARIHVVDNGSRDRTAAIAREHGAAVLTEPRRGYGQACLSGIAAVEAAGATPGDAVCFVDADHSDDPSQLLEIAGPVLEGQADLVIGSRVRGERERGALTPVQHFGNWLATRCIGALTGVRFTDLGPFRAIEWDALRRLEMRDRAFGWTVEMQLKAAHRGLRCVEVPARYRRRIGKSKISGTVMGSLRAGTTILATIARFGWQRRRA